MKKLINSKYFKWFRKLFLKKIYKNIDNGDDYFCCHVMCIYRLFICWKELKEVKENMDSKYLSEWIKVNPNQQHCKNVWFDSDVTYNQNRLLFLKECLSEF